MPVLLRAAILSAALAWPAVPATAAMRLAVFDFELIDTSLEGEIAKPRADEQRRLAMIGDELQRALAERGHTIVDPAPVAEAVAAVQPLHGCNGCAGGLARRLGARLAVTGTVQKVSNLILNINVSVWDAESGQERYRASADIRGNTDESWSRGLSWLVRNRLLAALADIEAGPR